MRIFIAGLSKSGKSTRSRYAATVREDVDYISISELLDYIGGTLPVYTIEDALANQKKAIAQLKVLPIRKCHQLIDGHVLIETARGPFIVPDEFFGEIKPSLMIHIEDTPRDLYERRSHSGRNETPAELSAMASMEKAACKRIAVRHRIPLIEMHSPTAESFVHSLGEQLDQLSVSRPEEDR